MGYAKQETMKTQRKLVSKAQRNKRKILVNMFKIILFGIVAVVVGCAGAGFGMMKGILDNAPSVDDINIVPRGFKSYIYDTKGNIDKEISTIGTNREYVYYEDIPQDWINAFVAIEDERFWEHNGIDVKGILRAGVHGIANVMKGNEMNEGASTLTQQLIKNNVYNVGMNETTFMDKLDRKIQEQYLALELEKKYSKEQIIEYYLNTIYLGRGVNGIYSAAQKYFGKNMDELTVSEIAAIAGITQNPSAYDPVYFPEDSAKRRKMVLKKMLELNYITKAQYDEAMSDDVYARIDAEHEIQMASSNIDSYYVDAIMDQLVQDFVDLYGVTENQASAMIFSGGYSIYSVQDKDIQKICDSVINDPSYIGEGTKVGLSYDLTLNVPGEGEVNYGIGHLIKYFKEQTGNTKYNNIYISEETARQAADQFKEAMLERTGGKFAAETFRVSPQPQFAFTIMDQKTGYVKAIVGGRGKKDTNRGLNRATNSKRQPGSCFKILAAYLPYIDACGGSLCSPHLDEPYSYANGTPVKNWWGASYRGYVTVRTAIKDSMNIIAVKTITEVTPEVAYDYLIKVGLTTIVDQETGEDGMIYSDKTQATALGGLTYGIKNYEINAAYAAIANGGVYTKPVFYSKVVDHDGNVIIDNTTPTTHEAMRPTTAWLLIDGMKTVLTGGTGTRARMKTGIACAGKTGTTSNSYDLYFCGMTPYYTASIWMGFDSNVSLNGYDQGIHCVIWRDIMDQIAIMENQDPTLDFEKPDGITTVTLCQITGKLPGEECPTFTDYAAAGYIPGEKCGGHEMIKFCCETHKVATNTCPTTVTFATDLDENGNKRLVDAEDGYEYTEEVCPLHPEQPDELTIKSRAGKGGSISASATVERGSSVTFIITPDPGYRIYDVTVNGESVGAVSSYTFRDVQNNASIAAKFKKKDGGSTRPDPTTEEPTTEEPTEEPTTEEPTTEEPTVEPSEEPSEEPIE